MWERAVHYSAWCVPDHRGSSGFRGIIARVTLHPLRSPIYEAAESEDAVAGYSKGRLGEPDDDYAGCEESGGRKQYA
jgi:hypothetical protein